MNANILIVDDEKEIAVQINGKTRCVIITDSDHVILSALQAETVAGRLGGSEDDDCSRESEA